MLMRRCLIVFAVLCSGLAVAQDQLLSARHYGVLQGLPDPAVLDVTQDQNQQVWLSTSNGLAKFNGQTFDIYRNQPNNPNSLLGNSIASIEWVGQDMWLLVEEKGLSQFQRAKNQFSHLVSASPNDAKHLLNSDIFAITSDRDKNLYIFQFNAGVSVKSPDADTFTHHTKENADWLESLMFFDAEVSQDNQLWAITLDGKALHWNLNNNQQRWFQVVDDDRPGANGLYDVSIDGQGHIRTTGYAGVFKFDEQSNQFIPEVSEASISEHFGKHVSIRSSYSDHRGNLWLATLEGLLRYENGQLHAITLITPGQKQIKNMYVNKVFEDHEQNLWILTMEQGVFVVGNQWQHHSIIALDEESDGINAASMYADADIKDRLFFSHEFSSNIEIVENKANSRTSSFQLWRDGKAQNQFKPNVILADEGGLWIGAISGLFRYSNDSEAIKAIPLKQEGEEKTLTINQMLSGQNNDLWIHVHGRSQLWHLDKENSKEQNTINIKNADLVSMSWLSEDELLLVHKHQIWLLNTENQQWQLLLETPEFISHASIKDGQWWLVINGVLKLMHRQGDALQALSFEWPDFLKDFAANSVSQDHQGRLWLVSENGVLVFNPNNGKWRLLDTETGLPSQRVIAVFHKDDGSHWVVTSKGVVHWFDGFFEAEAVPATLNIDAITLNNEKMAKGDFSLPHQYGLFQVQFALSSYSQPKSHRFEYRLNDQATWQSVGSANELSLHDLTSGTYQLAIRGKNEQSDWSKPETINFKVQPPWWYSQTAWVSYALLLVLVVTLLRMLMRRRWLYKQHLAEALSRQHFAESQLDLTSSLVGALETDALLAKIKNIIADQIEVKHVLVAFWNDKEQWSVFSETIPEQQQLSLKMFAQQMQEKQQTHSSHQDKSGHYLTAWFWHSESRFGFIQLQRPKYFSEHDVVIAKALATQSSLALENARLFSEVNSLARKSQAANQAKDDFLAHVSHEVRTPMNGILGMNQLLMESELTSEQRDYTEAVAASGAHLLHIINDILDFSKIEAGQMTLEQRPFDLQGLLDDLLKMYTATAKQKGLLFHADVDPHMSSMRVGDVVRVKQILMNLLSNAFKFTSSGEVELTVTGTAHWLSIKVVDTGKGISEAQCQQLFEPFTQADSSITRTHGGTGLGLSIVKQLCEMMGGDVKVNSELGKGSTFSCDLMLPQCDADRGAVASIEDCTTTQSDSPLDKKQVLVLEDNAINQELMRHLLNKAGHEVHVFDHAEDALGALEAGLVCDLMLVDYHLPDINGVAFVNQARMIRPQVPCAILTADVSDQLRDVCQTHQIDNVLTKPLNLDCVYRLLKEN